MHSICYGLSMAFKNLGLYPSKNKSESCCDNDLHLRFTNVYNFFSADLTGLQALYKYC